MESKVHSFRQSHAQRRLWFLQSLSPNGTAYNALFGLRLRGRCDVDALNFAIDALIQKHEPLRTTFCVRDGQELQVVHPHPSQRLIQTDVSAQSQESAERKARALAAELGRKPFDLEKGPLFRPVLVRISETDHVLLLGLHHIIFDGWSLDILLADLAGFYDEARGGRARSSGDPSLRLQYADFADYERSGQSQALLEADVAYWVEKLGGPSEPLALHTDRPRPASPLTHGDVVDVHIPENATAKLRSLAQREQCTLFMVALSGLKALLFRYTRQSSISVGIGTANRNDSDVENLVGTFVNPLVIRSKLQGTDSYREVLRQVRQLTLDAFAHQQAPFEQVVKRLQLERVGSRTPLCDVGFIWQPQNKAIAMADLQTELWDVHCGGTKLDLMLALWEEEGAIRGRLEYSTELFEEVTARHFARHFEVLLEACAAAPATPIARLPYLDSKEREGLAAATAVIPNPAADVPTLVHQLFEAQVRRTPDAIAVSCADERLTYAQLDERANALARAIRQRRFAVDSIVALYFERSPHLIVGMLGVLKSGLAFLPLDPTQPQARLHSMLARSQCRLVVADESLGLGSVFGEARVLGFQTVVAEGGSAESSAPVCLDGQNAAYCIFTSGSTGEPKGVLVSHQGLVNFIHGFSPTFRLVPGTRVLQWANPIFDGALSEIFITLTGGGVLTVVPREHCLPGEDLVRVLKEHRIETLEIVPSVLAALPDATLPDLKTIVLVGEKASAEVVARWGNGRTLFNGYGPTETAIGVSWNELTSETGVSILGHPMAGVGVAVVDDFLDLVGRGMLGELCIRGAGVARGYVGQPGLTAERFVPDPFGPPGARMYRSGDMGRLRHDGLLEVVGRRDDQVKIRGYRIELGEIESVLRSHPEVRDAVVGLQTDARTGRKALVAFVCSDSKQERLAGELRIHASHKLPEFMLPSVVRVLSRMPLMPSGKIDRAALLGREQLANPLEAKWRERFSGASLKVRLPGEKPISSASPQSIGTCTFRLGTALKQRMLALCLKQRTTFQLILLAVFQKLLIRYGRDEALCVALGTSDGWILVRADRSAGDSLLQAAHRAAGEVAMWAENRQPLEQVLEALREEGAVDVPRVEVGFFYSDPLTAPPRMPPRPFDLLLIVRDSPVGFEGQLEFVHPRLDTASVERLSKHFVTFLERLTENAECPMSSVSYLPEDERRELA
jgi:amino acid adenylation domain-containing protein